MIEFFNMGNKNMKIGIMTFWWSNDNYGQILQCYALQTALKKMGHTPYLIRYFPQKDDIAYYNKENACGFIGKVRKNLGKIKRFLTFYKEKNDNNNEIVIDRKFDEFRKNFITQNKTNFKSFKEMQRYNFSSYNAFICGSDQVWSMRFWGDSTKAYHLCFVSDKYIKLAYAASFGGQLPFPDTLDERKRALSSFAGIGVREKEGVDICKQWGNNAVLVCDPALLCTKEDYYPIIEKFDNKSNEKYALCYIIGWETNFHIDDIRKYCKEKNLNIRFVFSQNLGNIDIPCNEKELEYLSVEEWMNAYKNSDIIFTNSFHGTAFAIIFEKNFVTFPIIGEMAALNDRIKTLLTEIELEDRMLDAETRDFNTVVDNSINWDAKREKIEIYRKNSRDWLKNCLLK